jgi:formamidopyrimidine-DNA glycosylase
VPELPEVETVVRELRPYLVGRRIASVEAGSKPLRRCWEAEWGPSLVGRRVQKISRRGKWILIRLKGELVLVFHLGMTGQLTIAPVRQPRQAHTHLIFRLDGRKEELRFRDVRRFGGATLFAGAGAVEKFFTATGLGPEPFDLDPCYWRQRLRSTNRCLKAVLLDQRVVAGVGNIYADESLFEAKLHPAQLGRRVTVAQANRLRQAIATVLRRAIDKRGSSIRDYIGGSGERGEYQDEFRVYGRTGQPCVRCKTPIEGIRLAGRSTHFCPRCQRVDRLATSHMRVRASRSPAAPR